MTMIVVAVAIAIALTLYGRAPSPSWRSSVLPSSVRAPVWRVFSADGLVGFGQAPVRGSDAAHRASLRVARDRRIALRVAWLTIVTPQRRAPALDVPVCPDPTPRRVAIHDVIGGAHVRPGT